MRSIRIWNDSPSYQQLREITSVLDNGGVIIYPTDTVYALACDALNIKAVERICRIKNINPAKHNLSIVCSDISQASEYVRIDNAAYRILRECTPGPFTFLLKTLGSLPKAFRGRKIVGVRIPDSITARAIVDDLGRPLMTSSIETDDNDYLCNPALISERYEGKVDLLVDGGGGGTELSTIVDLTANEPEILRQGKGVLPE